jgi:UDP-N-acetylglucosamine 2-epimerase
MRERGNNVIEVVADAEAIYEAVKAQIQHGSYPMNPIYGDGSAGKKIADILAAKTVVVQKHITY